MTGPCYEQEPDIPHKRLWPQANAILKRTGSPFWQDESYDHSLRRVY